MRWDEWSSDDGEQPVAAIAGLSRKPRADQSNSNDSIAQAAATSSTDPTLCSTWLRDVGERLSKYDVPQLSEQLVAVTSCAWTEFLSTQQPQSQEISKMQMRHALQTALEQQDKHDREVGDLLRHWLATSDKPNRKGKAAAYNHSRIVRR
jgi:hypothetical protein